MKSDKALKLLEEIGTKYPGLKDGKSIVDVCDLINHLTKVMKKVYTIKNKK